MKLVYTERVLGRLQQLFSEIDVAGSLDYYDRLREFRNYCERTPILAHCLAQLPSGKYDFDADWRDVPNQLLPGDAGYGIRWNAICQIVDNGYQGLDDAWLQLGAKQSKGLDQITSVFVYPIVNYLVDRINWFGTVVYILLRYKRWVEWFEASHLRTMYEDADRNGEAMLDKDLRRFLFESGIDYPFSQPDFPGGRADIVAQLETDDPLVLEVKVWDSAKNYKENRVRDGLRQATDYAEKYGKDRGYVVVFNLDKKPLEFVSSISTDEWPPRIEVGGRTYYFIDINIGEQTQPISQRSKGQPVETQRIVLNDLLSNQPSN